MNSLSLNHTDIKGCKIWQFKTRPLLGKLGNIANEQKL